MQLAGSADWGVHAWLKNYNVTSVFLKQVCDVEAGNVSLEFRIESISTITTI